VPGRIFSIGQFMCGFENWLVQLKVNPEFCEALLDRTLEIQLAMAEETLRAVGDAADILYLADDYGIQTGPLISPALFRQIFKPRMARLIRFLRERSSAKIAFHSCGSVYALLPRFHRRRRPDPEPGAGGRGGYGHHPPQAGVRQAPSLLGCD